MQPALFRGQLLRLHLLMPAFLALLALSEDVPGDLLPHSLRALLALALPSRLIAVLLAQLAPGPRVRLVTEPQAPDVLVPLAPSTPFLAPPHIPRLRVQLPLVPLALLAHQHPCRQSRVVALNLLH